MKTIWQGVRRLLGDTEIERRPGGLRIAAQDRARAAQTVAAIEQRLGRSAVRDRHGAPAPPALRVLTPPHRPSLAPPTLPPLSRDGRSVVGSRRPTRLGFGPCGPPICGQEMEALLVALAADGRCASSPGRRSPMSLAL